MSAVSVDPGVAPAAPVRAVVALGANLGDRGRTLQAAVRDLADAERVELLAVSAVLENPALKPDGLDASAPPYLNAVVLLRTGLAPLALLDVLLAVEQRHGRVRAEHWGDRTLDLDLIDYDGRVLDAPRLTLPHPRAHERDFVLVPWRQVDPDAVLPGYGRIDELPAAHPLGVGSDFGGTESGGTEFGIGPEGAP
ncbi:MAG: 2-amino-4-hydroxy-6-hydroxymethyldihydropteridine diphosphokinase [Actinomycetales bacterium]|nr:2-amino-4-hydroxy-6-hydroxymethyldihydropteridine diphosphokinase [Actinomycetales bacterium]